MPGGRRAREAVPHGVTLPLVFLVLLLIISMFGEEILGIAGIGGRALDFFGCCQPRRLHDPATPPAPHNDGVEAPSKADQLEAFAGGFARGMGGELGRFHESKPSNCA